ncbi:hypothetical protein FOA52_006455 [Chlamydomonas sp. UWO 241]|nr:hypothetical protein FOA52_006455 [Chlamydomonas sp. UWO 241]
MGLDLLTSEDEVAAIIAHETAHVLARHHAEKMSTMSTFVLVRLFFHALFGFRVPQTLLTLGFGLPYSRQAEHEADAIGLRLMAAACYNPMAARTMLSKLGAKEQQEQAGCKEQQQAVVGA